MILSGRRIKSLILARENIGNVLFWAIVLFQLTVLKHMWHIELAAKLVNFFLLICFIVLTVVNICFIRYRINVWFFYIIPALFIFLFEGINIFFNSIANPELYSYFGLLLQWGAFLIVPLLMKFKCINFYRLWQFFFYFMLFSVLLALLEYALVFWGIYPLQILETANGVFLSGKFALFHMLEGGEAHDRFYASFGEPGDLAMYLLPALMYAFFKRKYFALFIFLIALYFTRSLGGFIGLLLLIVLLPLFLKSVKQKIIFSALLFFIGAVSFLITKDYFLEQYEEKNESREVREQSFQKTITQLPLATVTYPFGMPLRTSTAGFDNDKLYFGSNFTPGYSFVLGGVFAFVGYVWVLLACVWMSGKSIFRLNISLEERVVFGSIFVLFTFVFQRPTVWDSALFSLLYSPAFLKFLDNKFIIGKN